MLKLAASGSEAGVLNGFAECVFEEAKASLLLIELLNKIVKAICVARNY
jgi:hypothetical protein